MEKDKSDIWAVILAAGESKRMKTPKLLLPFMGKTIIEKVIENVLSSNVDKVIVVIGARKEAIIKVISGLKVTFCYNENYKEGMLSSVKCGFRSLPESVDAAIVFQGDQPMIPCLLVNEVINSYRKSEKGIVIPVFKSKRGHPVLINLKYRAEIEELDDNEGLRALAEKFHKDVLEVEVNSPQILIDVDTPEDYHYVINQT